MADLDILVGTGERAIRYRILETLPDGTKVVAPITVLSESISLEGATVTVDEITGAVEITNDVGNAIPVSGAVTINGGALGAGDAVVGRTRANGVSGRYYDPNAGEALTLKTANGVATAAGDNVVLAGVVEKKIRVLSYALQIQEAGTVIARFQDTATATNRSMPWRLTAGASQSDGVSRPPGGDGHFYFETAEGVGLDLNLDSALDVAWEITYLEIE